MEPNRLRRMLRRFTIAVFASFALLGCIARGADAASFTASAVVLRDGNPTLLVDGRPFFFYGAAFFYERIPADRWRASMLALRDLGFNTLDLYVPWNWHERTDGEFDFDGHTNGRRNLRAVLALAREFHFRLVVRPGPVIRNEWRNGGYPAWLLTRPDYGMPLHDILEGRYPATATLQNANSDDAAAQWLGNATHMRYANRWLRAALHEFEPVADLVIAVQLDDDQGAYIDNQTWPAPRLQTYLQTLEAIVRGATGPQLPVFINTYEMKVTASAPVWAMGNWYQSDAYAIGEHDRSALEFSTGLLQTQTRFPVAMSEFQAGWLAAPEDPEPRPADPTNTTLALHTLLGLGTRGVIDFPAQDTFNPAGWEAPFANASYAWDAALDIDLHPSARYAPTKRFGDIVRADGSELADTSRLADGAIAYLTSAYDERRLTNVDVFAIVARTQAAQHACRDRHLSCDLVDLRFISDAALARYAFVVVPRDALARAMIERVTARLARYRARGGRIVAQPPDVVTPRAGGIADAALLLSRSGVAFLDIVNYDAVPHHIGVTHITLPNGHNWDVGPLTVPARDAVLLRDGTPATVRENLSGSGEQQVVAAPLPKCEPAPATPQIVEDDRAGDGFARVTLANAAVSVTFAPNAGARAFTFTNQAGRCSRNAFTSVGALRDDVAVQPPLSTTDRIGKYTRSFPAGTFNRPYIIDSRAQSGRTASVTLHYDAPDVVPNGARFARTISLDATDSAFTVAEQVDFGDGSGARDQHALRFDSFDTRGAVVLDERASGAVGFYFADSQSVAIVAWPVSDVRDVQLLPERTSTVVRLEFAPGLTHTRYAIYPAAGVVEARMILLKERNAVVAKTDSSRGGVAKW